MAYRFVEPRVRVGDGIVDFGGATLEFFDFGTTDAKITFSDVGLTIQNPLIVVADDDGLFGDIFLDIQATVTLKTANAVVVYGPLDIFSPSDSVVALAASAVSVLDTAANFTGTNVEAVLAEIATDWFELASTNTITGDATFNGADLIMDDNLIFRPLLVDYAVQHTSVSSSSNVTTLDLTTGNSFTTTLTENTTIAITNPPASGRFGEISLRIVQDGAGGAFTVSWPASVLWPSGTPPVVTVTNNAIDRATLATIDNGSEYLGGFSQAFA